MTWKVPVAVTTLAVVALSTPFALAHAAEPNEQHKQQMSSKDSQSRSARTLEDRVFVRLAEEAWAGGDFKVQAEGNTVTLSGTVPSEQAKQRMIRIARRTFGVADVRDQLQVKPSSATPPANTVPDRELAQRVAQQIASKISGAKAGQDWWLTGWRVEGPDNRWSFTVEAENGSVWLDGEVPRMGEIRTAVEAARQTNGVRSVRSNLQIDRDYFPYPAYGPHGHYPGYAWGPRPNTDRDEGFFRGDDDRVNAHEFRGLHAMTGEVTKIDKQKGLLSLRTQEGMLELHFPPSAVQNVKQGDRITVELGLKEGTMMPSASPETAPNPAMQRK